MPNFELICSPRSPARLVCDICGDILWTPSPCCFSIDFNDMKDLVEEHIRVKHPTPLMIHKQAKREDKSPDRWMKVTAAKKFPEMSKQGQLHVATLLRRREYLQAKLDPERAGIHLRSEINAISWLLNRLGEKVEV